LEHDYDLCILMLKLGEISSIQYHRKDP
jgi:hypothetical protein